MPFHCYGKAARGYLAPSLRLPPGLDEIGPMRKTDEQI